MYLIHEFHNLSWITEINLLFHDILIYWHAPVCPEACLLFYYTLKSVYLFLHQKSTYFKGVVYVGTLGHSICLPVSDTLISGLAVSTNELMSWIRCNWWGRHTIQNVQGWGYSRGPFHKTSLTNKPGLFQLVWLIVSWFGSK